MSCQHVVTLVEVWSNDPGTGMSSEPVLLQTGEGQHLEGRTLPPSPDSRRAHCTAANTKEHIGILNFQRWFRTLLHLPLGGQYT
jgi:hypothetical protein